MTKRDIPADFALEELFATLREQPEKLEGFYSTKQLSRILGRSRNWILQKLALAKEKGLLEVSRESFEGVDGRVSMRPVYKFNTNGTGEADPSLDHATRED